MSTEAGTTLSISVRHLHAVERHAAESYPQECCGFLLGDPGAGTSPGRSPGSGPIPNRSAEAGSATANGGGGDGTAGEGPERIRVHRVLPARNERQGEAAGCSYLIAPETVLAARREARRLGFEVVGYYHSHPDRPAEPSGIDREDAWPGMSYLIVSLEEGRPVAARSWRLRPDREAFAEEELEAVGHPATVSRGAVRGGTP